MSDASAAADQAEQGRPKALQEELRQLADVVGPAALVDLLLERSFQIGATDIHFDPTAHGLRIRLRVDGLLHDVLDLSADLAPPVISRLKLMANMDITEKRVAQDGHISNTALKQQRDIRVGSGPTIYGERIVLRLMPDATMFMRLQELGLDEAQIELVEQSISVPYGTVLSVGPVGCGKSTTMYACLEYLNSPNRSLVTIEDPVERRVEGVNQVQIDARIGFGFVEALRGVLRQDPNVMMVGEIRDPETAHIAVRAGLTGVVVLSTLHASDAASAIDVFREFDVPPMFIADSLQAIIGQRLLRKVCSACRTTFHPDAGLCQLLGIDPAQAETVELARGQGCEQCFQTGYHGRTGVFEILIVSDAVREAVLKQRPNSEIRRLAVERGMQTLEDSAKKKVLAGITTVEEMHSVLTAFPA